MKRLLMLITTFVLLAGCGRYDKINERMYEDTNQIIEVIEKDISDNEKTSMDDFDVIIEYQVKYDDMESHDELNGEERILLAKMDYMLMLHDNDMALASHDAEIQDEIDEIKHYMKTGE